MVIVITGATAGFGVSFAQRFVAAGHRVIAVGRRQEKLNQLKDSFLHNAHGVLPIALDVRDREAVMKAFSLLPEGFDEVDVLINNAGLALGLLPAHEALLDDWDTMIDTNIKGLTYCTRALLPGMVKRNRGHVINIGSTAGEWPYQGGNVYGATKAFVRQFSNNLRADLSGTRVRVTNIEPGITGGTEFSQVRFHGDRQRAASVYQGITPLSSDDIAEAVFWAATLPPHVNVNYMQIMPVGQTYAGLKTVPV
jgi:3-hydroxy acid dehydrogenase/malonic semialdehyde reductase